MVVEGLDTILMRDFRGGLNTQVTPYLIADNQVADVENLLFTDFGARLRKGASKYNATRVASAAIVGGTEFRLLDGRIFDILACNDQLYHSPNSGTFTSFGIANWDADSAHPVYFDQFQNTIYATNGLGPVLRIRALTQDGSDTQILSATKLEPIQAPTTLATVKNHALLLDALDVTTDWVESNGGGGDAAFDIATSTDEACAQSTASLTLTAGLSHTTAMTITKDVSYDGVAVTILATFTKNSRTVTGSGTTGTAFLANVNPGDVIGTGASPSKYYRVAIVVSDTSLILSEIYAEDTVSPAAVFKVVRDYSRSDALFMWAKSNTVGELLMFGFGEAAYTENLFPIEFREANRWELKKFDLTAIPATSRDRVEKWGFHPARATGAAWVANVDHLYDGGGLTTPGIYRYRYSYEDEDTQIEGNAITAPSVAMETNAEDEATGLNKHGMGQITVTGTGRTGVDTIKIYRAGGLWADNLYLLVEEIPNPGQGSTYTYVDTHPDVTLSTENVYKAMPAYAEFCQEYMGRMFWAGGWDEGPFEIQTGGTAISTSTARTAAFTPTILGPVQGVAIYLVTTGTSSPTLSAALEKYVNGGWHEQGIATLATTGQTLNTWYPLKFPQATAYGDLVLTPLSSTWRVRIWSTTAGTHPTIGTSDGTNISYKVMMDYARRLFISNLYEPEVLPVQDLTDPDTVGTVGGYIDFPHEVMGLQEWLGRLMIFTKGGVYEFTGLNADEWTWPQVSTQGCDSSRSIVAAGEHGIFWYGNGAIWRYNGSSVEDVSEDVQATVQGIATAYEDDIAGGYDLKEQLVHFAYTASGTTNNAELVLDLETTRKIGRPSWTKFTGHAIAVYWPKSEDLYGGEPADGFAWHLNTGSLDADGSVAWVLETQHRDVSLGGREGRLRGLDVHADATTAAHTVTVTVKRNSVALSRTYTTDLAGTGLKFPRFEMGHECDGRYLAVKLSGSATERIKIHQLFWRSHHFR